ncbi:hypothetical protein [Spirulina major]|uniref:hypothetical protein n=1 Tax=Spirulina major TaxID=270636 RepID=UPI0011146F57|nr:hypothetical protein [Spirulina major]
MVSVQSSLETIAQSLTHHGNALRIRKLMFCACTQRWEHDRALIENIAIAGLIKDLYNQYPNFDALTQALFAVVKQLNRKSEYSRLAETILDTLHPLYQTLADEGDTAFGSEASTNFTPDTTQFSPLPSLARPVEGDETLMKAIAHNLSHTDQNLRIRKMLWCLNYNEWQSEPQVLFNLDLPQLLGQLHHDYPTLEDIHSALHHVANHVSRPSEYQAIAAIIVQHMSPLYQATPAPASDPTVNQADNATQVMIQTTLSPPDWDDLSELPNLDFLADTPGITTAYELQSSTNFTPATPPRALQSPALKQPQYDRYMVRLEVMKYANPLRAKILAYSTVHHKFEHGGHEWSNLRTEPFDDLLWALYDAYPIWDRLVKLLCQTAEQLDAPDESMQAAEAIAKALKPFYSPTF